MALNYYGRWNKKGLNIINISDIINIISAFHVLVIYCKDIFPVRWIEWCFPKCVP